jgi:formate/nitrite transporter FocA (FNT family)
MEKSKFFVRSLLSGLLIGFGCIAYVITESHIVGSFLFSLGLLTVIIQGGYLYTGKVGYGNTSELDYYKNLLAMLILNLCGIGLLCHAFSFFSGLPIDVSGIVAAKYSESISEAFLRALGCGAMMYIAVDGHKNNNHPLTVIMPVMCFILCGFDHCIANYGYMAMNGDLFCWQLPVWVVGNGLGSLMIRMLTSKEPTSFKLI